jgi:transcriptional adapter 2-alpha
MIFQVLLTKIAAIDDFGQKYHCDHCSKDITHLLIIRCAECQDFDLCISCFSGGIEIKDHKKTHSYRVIDILDFPIFESDWGADEELLLVEGLEMFGLGNWETISEHIGTKNKLQVEHHYNRVYVQSHTWPYPVLYLNKDMTDHFDLSPGKRPRARQPGHSVAKLAKCPRAPASQPANHEIHGYMPGRKEFEHEFENDADQIVKDIEFEELDTKEDFELKCAVLNSYNRILDLRKARKEFIFDRNFVDFKKIQSIEKKRPRDEKELYQKYRVFAKMQTVQDFEDFMEGMMNELKLRQKIQSLQEYLRMGITTHKESLEYEREKLVRVIVID